MTPHLDNPDPHNYRESKRRAGTCHHCTRPKDDAIHAVPPITDLPHRFKHSTDAPHLCRRCGKVGQALVHRKAGMRERAEKMLGLTTARAAAPSEASVAKEASWTDAAGEPLGSTLHAKRERVVRIHPLPDPQCSEELARYVAKAVRGAVRSFIAAHGEHLDKRTRGMMTGSIGKRAVNQLCCAEGRAALVKLLT